MKKKNQKENFSSFFLSSYCLFLFIFILLDLFCCTIENRKMTNDHQEDNNDNNEQQT